MIHINKYVPHHHHKSVSRQVEEKNKPTNQPTNKKSNCGGPFPIHSNLPRIEISAVTRQKPPIRPPEAHALKCRSGPLTPPPIFTATPPPPHPHPHDNNTTIRTALLPSIDWCHCRPATATRQPAAATQTRSPPARPSSGPPGAQCGTAGPPQAAADQAGRGGARDQAATTAQSANLEGCEKGYIYIL
jgi:hypothetical protein